MATNNPQLLDVPFKIHELGDKQEHHFKKLFRQNEDNYSSLSGILDRLDALEMQTGNVRGGSINKHIPDTTWKGNEDNQECPEQEMGQRILGLENENRMLKLRLEKPEYSLAPHSVIRADDTTHPDGFPNTRELQRELQAAKEEVESLKYTIASMGTEDDAKARILALETENRMLKYGMQNPDHSVQPRSMHNFANKDLEGRAQITEKQYSDLNNSYLQLKGRSDELFQSNSAKERRIKELEQELNNSKREDMFQGRNSGMSNLESLKLKEEEIARTEETLHSLQQENASMQEEIVQLRFPKADSLTKSERELLQSLLKDKDYLSSQLNSCERQISDLGVSLEMAERRCNDLEAEYGKAAAQRDQLYQFCEQQKLSFSHQETDKQAFENALRGRDALIHSLKQQITEKQTIIETLQASEQVLQSEYAQGEAKWNSHDYDTSSYREQLAEKDKKISELHFQIEKDKNIQRNPQYPLTGGYYTGATTSMSGPIPRPYSPSSTLPPSGTYNAPSESYNAPSGPHHYN